MIRHGEKERKRWDTPEHSLSLSISRRFPRTKTHFLEGSVGRIQKIAAGDHHNYIDDTMEREDGERKVAFLWKPLYKVIPD